MSGEYYLMDYFLKNIYSKELFGNFSFRTTTMIYELVDVMSDVVVVTWSSGEPEV
jgi:hypothetical protein